MRLLVASAGAAIAVFCIVVWSKSGAQPVWPGRYDARGPLVTLNFQVTLPVTPGTAPGDWTASMTKANQALSDMVNRECDVVRGALGGTCRLSHLNLSTNIDERQEGYGGGSPAITAMAQATFVPDTAPPKH